MKAYLSRRPNGSYMLTARPPVRREVGMSGEDDLYIAYTDKRGDPLGVLHLCPDGVAALGIELEPFETIKVEITVTALE